MNAHPDIERLLALRDGEPVEPGFAAHVDGCAECRAELARLRALLQTKGVGSPCIPASSTY